MALPHVQRSVRIFILHDFVAVSQGHEMLLRVGYRTFERLGCSGLSVTEKLGLKAT